MIPQLRDYQKRAIEDTYGWMQRNPGNPCIVAPTGCHAKGQGILMANGDVKAVENVQVGDLVMGGDGTPRKVLELHHGYSDMYKIVPLKGAPFIVNKDHVLSLITTNEGKNWRGSTTGAEIENISVADYLLKCKSWRHLRKLYKGTVKSFLGASETLPIPPYIIGILLGDGHIEKGATLTTPDHEVYDAWEDYLHSINCIMKTQPKQTTTCCSYCAVSINAARPGTRVPRGKSPINDKLRRAGIFGMVSANKVIPRQYKTSSFENRLELIAGLLDTDGSLSGSGFDFISKSKQLSEDLAFICRSVGLQAKCTPCKKKNTVTNKSGIYFRVSISGDCSIIPCRVPRKQARPRKQKKRTGVTGFSVEPAGFGEYFGFETDGDHLYMLSDFTVTHNSGKSWIVAGLCEDVMRSWPKTRIVILSHVKELLVQDAEKLLLAWPEAPLGIYSAGLGRKDVNTITIAGIQSVWKKAEEFGKVDLVIVDECHLINNEGCGMYRTLLNEFKMANPHLRVLGLTATPYRLGQGMVTEGEDSLFDGLIESISIEELVERGYLARLRSKFTDRKLDVDGIRKRGGDFVEHELQARVDTEDDNAAIVAETIRRAEGRQSWLFFCTGVEHALHMRDELRRQGVAAETVTGDTPKEQRAWILDDFKAGRVRAVTNMNVLCLDEETEILTSDGFIGIDEMSPSHMIAAWREDGGIDFTPPQTIIRRDRAPGEQMVCLGNGMGANIRVTANHRMVVRCGRKRCKLKVVSAENLIGKPCTIPAFGESLPLKIECEQKQEEVSFSRQVIAVAYHYRKKGIEAKKARQKAEKFVGRVRNAKYKNPHELTLDECAFIGFWLGDGTKSCGRYSISQSLVYPDIVAWAESLFSRIGIHYTKSVYPPKGNMKAPAIRWNFARGTGGDGQEVEGGYYPYEPYLNKAGSKLLLGLDKPQLLALLEGLWKADGVHHGKILTKTHYIHSTSLPLLDILQAACSMRGVSAVLSKSSLPRKVNHRQQYRFAWGGRNSWSYTKNSSRLETQYKKERVWCVTSSTSFLICRRRGRVFVTGNTTGFDHPDIDLIVMARPTLSPGLYLQMAGRGMRVKSGPYADCLVLDFAGNIARHGPVTDVRAPNAREKRDPGEAPVKECPECMEAVPAGSATCPCCGYVFPERPKERPELNKTEDIMGGPVRMEVRSWFWSVQKSRKNGTPMIRVDFYGKELMADVLPLYLCLMHGGYAEEKARKILYAFTGHRVGELAEDDLCDIAKFMNASDACPSWVEYRRKGNFPEITKWGWEDAIDEAAG